MDKKKLVEAFEQGHIYIKGNPNPVPVKYVSYSGVTVEGLQAGYKTTITYTPSMYGTYWGIKPEDIK